MSFRKRSAFSLLEVIAAVIILAVVATATVATVAPMRAKSSEKIDDSSLAMLNGMAQSYYLEKGTWPTASKGVQDLANAGYIDYVNQNANYLNLVRTFEWDNTAKVFKKKP